MSVGSTSSDETPPRRQCVRCGAPLSEQTLGVCMECGASNVTKGDLQRFVPEAFRRNGSPKCIRPRYHALISSLTAVLSIAAIAGLWWLVAGNKWLPGVQFIMILSAILVSNRTSQVLVNRHRVQLRDDLVHADFGVCLRCGYRLDGLPHEHQCPECGLPYELQKTRALWIHFLNRANYAGMGTESMIRQAKALRTVASNPRTTCIRCGTPLGDGPDRTCPECGAANRVDPDQLAL